MTGKLISLFKRESRGGVRALLPWHLNGTLSAAEQQEVTAWLRDDAEARAELADWQQVQAAVAEQPPQFPSSQVQQRVMAEVRARSIARRPVFTWPQLAWGAALAMAVLVMLWITVQPGIVLQWAVADGPPMAFRVYRAPAGSADFGLIGELAADIDAQNYSYVDTRLLPGQRYVYRVEAVGHSGQMTASQAITASALEALPGQLAILLTSLMVGYGAMVVIQRARFRGWWTSSLIT